MSSIIADLAVRGAHQVVDTAEEMLRRAVSEKGADAAVEFPNTGYHAPVAFSILGIAVGTLAAGSPARLAGRV